MIYRNIVPRNYKNILGMFLTLINTRKKTDERKSQSKRQN